MAEFDIDVVRLVIREELREYDARLQGQLSGINDRISTVADATAAALVRLTEADAAEDASEDASEEAPEETPEEAAEAVADVGEETGGLAITTEGEVLEETGEVTTLTPAEALADLAPERTHPFLRRIRFGRG